MDFMCKALGTDTVRNGPKPNDLNYFADLVKGLKFRAVHLNYNRSFIISGLSKDSIDKTMFTIDSDGRKRQTSVLEYFRSTYGSFFKTQMNPKLPAVQVGRGPNVKYFPVEVCHLLSDEVYRRKLDPYLQGMVTRKSSQQVSGVVDRPENSFQWIVSMQWIPLTQILRPPPAKLSNRIADPLLHLSNSRLLIDSLASLNTSQRSKSTIRSASTGKR